MPSAAVHHSPFLQRSGLAPGSFRFRILTSSRGLSVIMPHDFSMAAVAERFVRRMAAPAQGGFGSVISSVAIGTSDLDLAV